MSCCRKSHWSQLRKTGAFRPDVATNPQGTLINGYYLLIANGRNTASSFHNFLIRNVYCHSIPYKYQGKMIPVLPHSGESLKLSSKMQYCKFRVSVEGIRPFAILLCSNIANFPGKEKYHNYAEWHFP